MIQTSPMIPMIELDFIEEKSEIIRMFINSLKTELNRLPEDKRNMIVLYFVDLVERPYVSFLTTNSLLAIVEMVFNNSHLRDFVLNLAFRYNLETIVSGVNVGPLIDGLIKVSKDTTENGLIPEVVKASLKINQTEKLFLTNDWLVVYLLTIIYINHI